ncbi:sugar transferase [Schaalia sp. 19OD2882]|uniref:sugar transferase n=1 Tax=Schaalia sp. 19OD2882 TaxID=2794089 RepID=UPI001C1EF80F|nr:sugar transferase [Schaalia sp. 19OD2882]QWW19169.1 sugar transferase [Schaalia sp. 19OD2882]
MHPDAATNLLVLADSLAVALVSSLLVTLPLGGALWNLWDALLGTLLAVGIWALGFLLTGVFSHRHGLRARRQPRRFAALALVGFTGLTLAESWTSLPLPSPLLAGLILPALVALMHELHSRVRTRSRDRSSTALLLAPRSSAVPLEELLVRHSSRLGLHIGGLMEWDDHVPLSTTVLADRLDQIVPAMEDCGAGVLLLTSGSATDLTDLQNLRWCLEDAGMSMAVVLEPTCLGPQLLTITSAPGVALMRAETRQYSPLEAVVHRLFDLVASTLLLMALAPLFAVLFVLVRREDGGPAFFLQQRVGRHRQLFPMVKFRTMTVDAEARLAELREQERAMRAADGHGDDDDPDTGVLFKLKDDPRITRVGRFLRRTSLDELPQLFNVWCGHMSLVGPRPPLPHEVEQYEPRVMRKFNVRPGMTGLWQVSGRSNLPWTESVRLDLHYVENRSFLFDMRILLRTVAAVLRQEGAY